MLRSISHSILVVLLGIAVTAEAQEKKPIDDANPRSDSKQDSVKKSPRPARRKEGAKSAKKGKTRKPLFFRWVNPPNYQLPGVQHATFRSESMGIDVGYCVYLPTAYKREKTRRFPVVYYLHGGRPGSESKSLRLATQIHAAMEKGLAPPMVYVFVNGGPVSHYNMRNMKHGMGADVFIKELIPHVDASFRTIANRDGRGIEGFSQGGRGTARLMFRHPELFCSAAPGGGGHATEKRISENEGRESENLKFDVGDNTWDLAREYAKQKKKTPALKILVYVGTKGFNYENNLQYMDHLKSLGIPFEKLIVQDAPHSGKIIYEKQGAAIMQFHASNFGLLKKQHDTNAR